MLSKTQIDVLRRLRDGAGVAASSLRGDIASELLDEGLLTVRAKGSRRSFVAVNVRALGEFLASRFVEFRDLGAMTEIMAKGFESRHEQAALTGDSKLVSVRSCPGFPVNSYTPIRCLLRGKEFVVNPCDGSFLFVSDWENFGIPSDVVVVGVENMENFRLVRSQRAFFDEYLGRRYPGEDRQALFVSRYPQSTDLRRWLQSVPNDYIHFGDFDLAGISIFQNEFQRYMPDRSSYLIPSDVEARISAGSSKRYDSQYHRYRDLESDDPELQRLIDIIHRHRKGYDQEGYIPLAYINLRSNASS